MVLASSMTINEYDGLLSSSSMMDLSWLSIEPVMVLGLFLCVLPLVMSIVPREHLPYETRRATMRFFVLAAICTLIYHLVAAIPFSSACEHCSFWSDFETLYHDLPELGNGVVERAWHVFLQSEGFQWSSVFTIVVNKLDKDSAAQTGGSVLSWNYWPVKAVEEYLAVERICACFFVVETVRHRGLWLWCGACMSLWAMGATYLALPIFILKWWAQTNEEGIPLMEIMSPSGCSSPSANGPLSVSMRALRLRRALSETPGYYGSASHYADDVKRHSNGMSSPFYTGAVGTTTSAATGGSDLSFSSPLLRSYSSPMLEPSLAPLLNENDSPQTPARALTTATVSAPPSSLMLNRRHSGANVSGQSGVVGTHYQHGQSQRNLFHSMEGSPIMEGRSLMGTSAAPVTPMASSTVTAKRASLPVRGALAAVAAALSQAANNTTANKTNARNASGNDRSFSFERDDLPPVHPLSTPVTPVPSFVEPIHTAAATTTSSASIVTPTTPASASKRKDHKIMKIALTPIHSSGSAMSEIASEQHRIPRELSSTSTTTSTAAAGAGGASVTGVRTVSSSSSHSSAPPRHQSAAAAGAEKRFEEMTRGMMSSVVSSSSTANVMSSSGNNNNNNSNGESDGVSSMTLAPGTAAAMLRSISEPVWSSSTSNTVTASPSITGMNQTTIGSNVSIPSFGMHHRRGAPRPLAIPSSDPSSSANSPLASEPPSPGRRMFSSNHHHHHNIALPMETKEIDGVPVLTLRTTRPESPGQPAPLETTTEWSNDANWWRWLNWAWWQESPYEQRQEAALKIVNITLHAMILATRLYAWAGIIRNLFTSQSASTVVEEVPSALRVERVLHLILVMGSHLSGVAFSGLRARSVAGLLGKQIGLIALTFMDVAIGMIFSLVLREFWTDSFEDMPPTSSPTPLNSPRQRTDRLKWQRYIGWQMSSGVAAVALLAIVLRYDVPLIVDIMAAFTPAIIASILWAAGHWRPELIGSWFKNRPVRTFMLIAWYGIMFVVAISLRPSLPHNAEWATLVTLIRLQLVNGIGGPLFVIVGALWNLHVIYSHQPEMEVHTLADLDDSEVATRLRSGGPCFQRRAVSRWPLKLLACIPVLVIMVPLLYNTHCSICTDQTGFEYPDAHGMDSPSHAALVAAAHREHQTVLASLGANRMACLRGQFVVNDFIARRHNQGLFIHGARYPAFLQFVAPKRDGDPHAMSIKLMAVGGDKLETDEHQTQDFQLWTSSHFPMEHDHAYDESHQQTPWEFIASLFSTHDERPHLINNPLVARYASKSPFRLGARSTLAVKYGVEPCSFNDTADARDRRNRRTAKLTGRSTYLLEATKARLTGHSVHGNNGGGDDVCLNFLIQEQRSGCKDPIEDDTRAWAGAWIKIAQLHIPAQEFWRVDQQKFCSQLRFTPWHTTAEHMPLGATNRARRTMTTNMTRVDEAHRVFAYSVAQGDGGTATWFEPNGSETFSGALATDPFEGAGDTLNYQYARYGEPYQNLPKLIAKLPQSEKFDSEEQRRFGVRIYEHIVGAAHRKGKDYESWTSVQDYQYLLNPPSSGKPISYPKSNLVETWNTDVAFAWQFIRGPNPMMITVCKKLPAALTMDNSTMARLAAVIAPESLDGLMATSRLFVIDYVDLVDVITFADRVVYAPIVLMYLHREASGLRYLKPLAIQLARPTPLSIPEVFTPLDAPLVWQFAKMHAQAADSMMHQMVYHLGLTHIAMEPMIIAFHRQFHVKHPIFRLMKPHLKHTFAINNLGRDSLLKGHDASFDRFFAVGVNGSKQLMQDAWVKGDFKARMPYRDLQARGFPRVAVPGSDDDILPGYFYRDDAYVIWEATLRYFTQCVYQIYDNEDELLRDKQVELFNREIHDPELADQKGAHQLTSRSELAEFLAATVFTMTAQHGAVGVGQYEFYSFIPNRPMLLTHPMPSDKSVLTDRYILKSLPNFHQSQQLITLMWFLSLSPVEAGGGKTGKHLLIDMAEASSSYQIPYRRLQAELQRLQVSIDARNRDAVADQQSGRNPWITPYTYLLPNEIPSSLAI